MRHAGGIANSVANSPTGENGSKSIRWFFFGLAAYLAVQCVSRICLSPSAHLDEAEQLVLTQRFSLGYNAQPPLYAWLQTLVFFVTDPGILGLAVLKGLILFGIGSLMFLIGRRATGSDSGGMLCAVSLAFLPEVIWESQRDLTHSVLAAFFSLLLAWSFLRVADTRRWRDYLLLGTALGLGLLTKYNIVIAAVCLIAAGLSLREYRPAILSPRFLGAMVFATLIFSPFGLWLLEHRSIGMASSYKFGLDSNLTYLSAVFIGLTKVFISVLAFIAPILVVSLVSVGSGWRKCRLDSPIKQLFARQFMVLVVLLLLCVLAFRMTGFRGRWLLPVLIVSPVLVVALILPLLNPTRAKRLRNTAIALAILTAIALPMRIILSEPLRREEPLNWPVAKIAPGVSALAGSNCLLLAESKAIAGNLRLAGVPIPVAAPDTIHLLTRTNETLLLVWETGRQPKRIERFFDEVSDLGIERTGEPATLAATLYFYRTNQWEIAVQRARFSEARDLQVEPPNP